MIHKYLLVYSVSFFQNRNVHRIVHQKYEFKQIILDYTPKKIPHKSFIYTELNSFKLLKSGAGGT